MVVCPRCGTENESLAIECKNCGIIFEKYEKSRAEFFRLAVEAFDSNEFDTAKELFKRISSDYPERAEEANKYVQKIEEATRDDFFRDALNIYNENKLDTAKKLFEQIKADYPELSIETDIYLKKIREKKRDNLLEKAVSAFEKKDYAYAEAVLNKLISAYPEKADEAKLYLKKIKEDRENWPINLLRVIAWIIFSVSIVGGLISFATIKNSVGFSIGMTTIVGGVASWAFFLVICLIAENLIKIRKNTEKSK